MNFNLVKFKKLFLIGVFFLVILFITFIVYKQLPIEKDEKEFFKTRDGCLEENEVSTFSLENLDNHSGRAKITITDKYSSLEIFSFSLDAIRTSYHPLELHNCSVYFIKEANIDYSKTEFLPGFFWALWKQTYSGPSSEILKIAERQGDNVNHYFSTDFRIDSSEKYLVLLRGYLGKDDYALIIKDLKTLEDVLEVPITKLESINSDIVGDIRLNGWSSDGRYFWANTHDGAPRLAFIRIDTKDWSVDVFPVPRDVLGGDALNYDKGLITVHPGNEWYGDEEIEQDEKSERNARGEGTDLYILNLITGERQFVTSTPEPLYYFQPVWISSSDLQYTIPSGEKRIFSL